MHLHWPTYFIEGNHDHLPSLMKYKEPTEAAPNLTYCPRGSVLTINRRVIGFLGGASSQDRNSRIRGHTWFEEEVLNDSDAASLRGQNLDILVTHTPPIAVVQYLLAREGHCVANPEPDPSAIVVQALWEDLGRPRLICGHVHTRLRAENVTVLGTLDVEVL